MRVAYAGSGQYLPSSTSAIFRVLKPASGLTITGRAVQNKTTITFTWKVVTGSGIAGFNITMTGSHHANEQANSSVIPAHTAAAYTFVAKNVKWDVDHFTLDVKLKNGSSVQAGPFTVYEPSGKPS